MENAEKTLREYLKVKKYLKIFNKVIILQIIFSAAMPASADGGGDPRYIGEMHPPVMASVKEKK